MEALELPTTTIITTFPQAHDPVTDLPIPARAFRIEWKNGFQYQKWVDTQEMRDSYIYLPGDNRQPNVHLLTLNTRGETETRLYQLGTGKLGWWISHADFVAPLSDPYTSGRPQQRGLEMLTSRERRMKKSPYRL